MRNHKSNSQVRSQMELDRGLNCQEIGTEGVHVDELKTGLQECTKDATHKLSSMIVSSRERGREGEKGASDMKLPHVHQLHTVSLTPDVSINRN